MKVSWSLSLSWCRILENSPDLLGVLLHLISFVPFQLQQKPDIVVAVARGDVKMAVVHRLSGGFSVVRKNIVSRRIEGFHHRCRRDAGCMNEIGKFHLGYLQKSDGMALRYHEDMSEMNRIDIEDRYGVLIPEEYFSGRFITENPAEYTLRPGR